MTRKPTKKCRVFVSRKTDDQEVSREIRDELQTYAGNLEFFDAQDIKPGEGWRERLRNELKSSNLLLLLLTKPARDDFDWPLYEAGLFESLNEEDRRKVICVYADPGEPGTAKNKDELGVPSQLGDKQAVRATKANILDLLMDLFTDKKFTNTIDPLNPNVTRERLEPIAGTITDLINRVEDDRHTSEYANSYIQLIVPPGAEPLNPEIEVKSDKPSLRQLFHLSEIPPDSPRWTWGRIYDKAAEERDLAGFNGQWIRQLADAILAMKTGDTVQQLTGRYLAANGKLYRPEIEIYKIYVNGRITVDVTFSEQVQDSWLKSARAPVALAANLALASRIRHELIDPFLLKTPRWRTDKARKEGCAKLSRLVEQIELDGYFIEQMTESRLQEAFDEAETEELGGLFVEFVDTIRPQVHQALSRVDIGELRQGLKLWKENNLRFLRIGLQRYEAMFEGPSKLRLVA